MYKKNTSPSNVMQCVCSACKEITFYLYTMVLMWSSAIARTDYDLSFIYVVVVLVVFIVVVVVVVVVFVAPANTSV